MSESQVKQNPINYSEFKDLLTQGGYRKEVIDWLWEEPLAKAMTQDEVLEGAQSEELRQFAEEGYETFHREQD